MILFWLREAIKIFGRAKSSFILSLISLSISIVLIAASIYTVSLSGKIEEKIKSQLSLNIFLDDSLSTSSIKNIREGLSKKKYITSVTYIDKEEAARIFIEETGEDFRKILDYNPLPASLSLNIKPEYVIKDSLVNILIELNKIVGIDEIVYENQMLMEIVSKLKELQKYIIAITIILVLISIYITYSTIKLIINLKHDELETMKLVGAKLSTIKLPIILNEIITGIIAGLLSFLSIKFFLLMISKYGTIPNIFMPTAQIYIFMLIIGPILSLIVSIVILRKISLKI
jgi:cell division transport system permease protein